MPKFRSLLLLPTLLALALPVLLVPGTSSAGTVCRTVPVRADFLRARTPRLFLLETHCHERGEPRDATRELHSLCDLLIKAYGPDEGRARCRAAVEDRLGDL